MGRLVAIRHGETAWSRSGKHTSRSDIALTEEGRAAALDLAPRLMDHRYTSVLSSPRKRAVDTAVLAGFADRLVIDDDLVEWDYGDYEGRTTADIRVERPGWTIWDNDPPNGETAADVAARADHIVEAARRVDGDVLVFSHAHFLRVLAARWVGLGPEYGRHFALSTASMSVLGWQREDPVVELWNDSSHLHAGPRGDWDRAVS